MAGVGPEDIQILAARCVQQLQVQGYAVLPGFLTEDQLDVLRLEADTLFELGEEGRQCNPSSAPDSSDSSTTASGGMRWGREASSSCIYESIPGQILSRTPKLRTCYQAYRAHRSVWPLRAGVWQLLFQSHLTRLVVAILGSTAVLFNDQYIIKPPGTSLSSFQWHRDSDWCRTREARYAPYISVWCALDDMTQSNGCFVVQPGSQLEWGGGRCSAAGAARQQQGSEQQQDGQEQQAQGHLQQQQQQQHEQRHAVALEVAAGTAIITSDTVLHCSGPNHSRHMRRAWMPQFSAAPLVWRGGSTSTSSSCVSLAIPCVPPKLLLTTTNIVTNY